MDTYDQGSLILSKSGVTDSSPQVSHSEEHHQYAVFSDVLVKIHGAKAVQYGDYLKTHGDETSQLFAMQHFCDIKRKYVRAKVFMERMARGEDVNFEDLLDTYSDLAVYAIMGLQMAFHCMEKTEQPEVQYHQWKPEAPSSMRMLGPEIDLRTAKACMHGKLLTEECADCKDDIPF